MVASSFACSCGCDRCGRCPGWTLMRQVRVALLLAMGCVGRAGRRPGLVPVALDAWGQPSVGVAGGLVLSSRVGVTRGHGQGRWRHVRIWAVGILPSQLLRGVECRPWQRTHCGGECNMHMMTPNWMRCWRMSTVVAMSRKLCQTGIHRALWTAWAACGSWHGCGPRRRTPGPGLAGRGAGAARGGRSRLRASLRWVWRPWSGLARLRSPPHRGRPRCHSWPPRSGPRRARRRPLPRRRPPRLPRRRRRRGLPGSACEGSSRHHQGLCIRQVRSMRGWEIRLQEHARVEAHAVTLQKC